MSNKQKVHEVLSKLDAKKPYIRPKRFVTETCSQCKRPGWTHENRYKLETLDEFGDSAWNPRAGVSGRDFPDNYQLMIVRSGVPLYPCIQEAIDFCKDYDLDGAGFMFNNMLVLVTADSSIEDVIRKLGK